ncbi:hypothetical protein [Rhodoferax mekongensis]|uniref:Uncharacterized protein n=1 Tax=Rhodoferax mekongensis TaxID=3068341 RepID=A0ABZ0B2B4_9BURK|nr:hypothetical protein [Rhodoferax sp. TBRC 17307]WNO06060.1 hypothetical protein RAN89_06415 [Rhodoferax sp. TBRC 17307]
MSDDSSDSSDSSSSSSNYSNEGRNYTPPSGGFSSNGSFASQYASYGSGREAAERAGGYGYGSSSSSSGYSNEGRSNSSQGGSSGSSSSRVADSYGGENRTVEQRQSEEAEGGIKSILVNNTGRVLGRNGLINAAIAQQHQDFVNGKSGAIGDDLRAAYESLSDEDKKAYLLETHKPVSDVYTYDPLNKGLREKWTDMTTGKVGSAWRTLGGVGGGTSSDQYFDNETPEERDARGSLNGSIIGKVADALSPAPFSILKNGAQMVYEMSKGVPFNEAGSRLVPGLINRFATPVLNRATGGAVTAFNIGNAASAAFGGPSVKSIGDAAWSAVGGGQPTGQETVNNPDTGKPYLYPDSTPVYRGSSSNSSPSATSTSARQAPAAPVVQGLDVDANLFGNLDQSGWRSATSKLAQSRKKGTS